MKHNVRILAGLAIVAACLLAAPSLRAQSPKKMEPAKVLDRMLGNYEREMVPLAEAMPADKYNFAPTAGEFKGVRTFAEQVKHVAGANYFYFGSIASSKPTMPKMADVKTKEQIVQALKDSFTYAHQQIATITPDNAFDIIGSDGDARTRAGTAAAAVAHGFDHYGQLVEYLRMNGIVPPASRH